MIVQAQSLHIWQDQSLILKDINFELQEGEFAYLIGKTGSGKTSLIKSLYAELRSFKGELMVCGENLALIKKKQIPYFRRKIGIVFQDFQLLDDRNVEENLLFVMQATAWKDAQKMQRKAQWALSKVGMESFAQKMPYQLSGGEQQRVAIARALVNNPQLILADEPTGNLDPQVAQEMLQLFAEIHQTGVSLILATHHYDFLKKYPQRVLHLDNQELIDTHASKL